MARLVLGQPTSVPTGENWRSEILHQAGLPQDNVFNHLVREAHTILHPRAADAPQRQRPEPGITKHMRDNACEANPVLNPEQRLVKETSSKREHLAEAIRVPFPEAQKRYELSPESEAALDIMMSMSGPDLAKWRQKQIDFLGKLAHKCKPLTTKWFAMISDVPAGVKSLREGFNVAFLAVLLEAIDWPDKGLCSLLLRGFPLYGDLRELDSHIFRKKSEEEIEEELPAFNKSLAELHNHDSNLTWLETCESVTMAQSTGTPQLGKRKESSESVDINATRENLLFEVYRETQDQESRGFLGPAMTKEQLIPSHTVKGVFLARPLPRFGINQGFKLNSHGEWVMKARCIDDAKRAGVNADTLMGESLVMPTFEFIARAGAYVCKKSDNSPEFDLLLGLEDMFAAYRRFGNSSVHVSVVSVFNPHTRLR